MGFGGGGNIARVRGPNLKPNHKERLSSARILPLLALHNLVLLMPSFPLRSGFSLRHQLRSGFHMYLGAEYSEKPSLPGALQFPSLPLQHERIHCRTTTIHTHTQSKKKNAEVDEI